MPQSAQADFAFLCGDFSRCVQGAVAKVMTEADGGVNLP